MNRIEILCAWGKHWWALLAVLCAWGKHWWAPLTLTVFSLVGLTAMVLDPFCAFSGADMCAYVGVDWVFKPYAGKSAAVQLFGTGLLAASVLWGWSSLRSSVTSHSSNVIAGWLGFSLFVGYAGLLVGSWIEMADASADLDLQIRKWLLAIPLFCSLAVFGWVTFLHLVWRAACIFVRRTHLYRFWQRPR